MNRLLTLGVVLTLLFGCSDSDPEERQTLRDTHYFPLELDSYIDYQVQELVFRSEGRLRDTLSYQLREEVANTFLNNLGETVYLIDRYKRNADGHDWEYINTSQAYISQNKIIRIDDNTPYIKMQLPVRKDQEWDGNQLFDKDGEWIIGGEPIAYFKEWKYKIINDQGTLEIANENISSILEISQADFENQIEIRKSKEWYAPNIGLVKKTMQIIDTQCFDSCDGMSWEEKGEKGHIYLQEMVNYN